MELTKEEKEEIILLLKKRNKSIWTDHIIGRLFKRINEIRLGTLSIKDWYIKDYISLEEYLHQLNLTSYVNGKSRPV